MTVRECGQSGALSLTTETVGAGLDPWRVRHSPAHYLPQGRQQQKEETMKTCDVCGYNNATEYLESPDYHEEGEGEYYCAECLERK